MTSPTPLRVLDGWPLGVLAIVAAGAGVRGIVDHPRAIQAPTDLDDLPPSLREHLVATSDSALLSWRAPDCPQVYRVEVDETHAAPDVATYLGREAERSTSWLALAPDDERDDFERSVEWTWIGRDDEAPRVLRRSGEMSAEFAGPGAPDAACRPFGWDRIEDAIALGWPRLPGRRVRPGDTWAGATIQGKCNHTACVTAQGRTSADEPCTVGPWRATMAALGDAAGGVSAVVESWQDVDAPETSVRARRTSIVADGRLLWSRTAIVDAFRGATREVEFVAVDDCGGVAPADLDRDATAAVRAVAARESEGIDALVR
jgi:hypothetical protein